MALFINSRPVNNRSLHNQTLTLVDNKSSKKMTLWGRCWIFSCSVIRGGEISAPHYILILCLPPSPISLPLEFPENHNKMKKFEGKVIGKKRFLLFQQWWWWWWWWWWCCRGGLQTKLCPTLATPWTVACLGPLSMGFSRQEYWSVLPFPSPEDLPDPGIKPNSLTLQADSLLTELQGFS